MFAYHPEIARKLGLERQAKALDQAARERLLASARDTQPKPAVRWLAVAIIAVAPITLVMVWVLIVR